MKILLCSPLTGKVGGISLWTQHITTFFKENDFNVTIQLFDTARKYDVYPSTPILTRALKGAQDYTSILKNIKIKLKEDRFNILHLVSSGSVSLVKDYLILRWAKQKKIQTVIHFHFGRIPEIFENKKWEYKLFKKVADKADKIIVIDSLSFDKLINEGIKNVFYLPNPLSPQIVKTIDQNRNITRKANKIMFAGNVIPTKGIFELIDATKNLKNVEVNILGAISDEMKTDLKKRVVSSLCIYDFMGEVSQDKIIKEMLSSNVFVLPSYTEGFPNVILESMASGCAIVATNVGAIPEMLDISTEKPCGITVEVKNCNDLSKALNEVLLNNDLAQNLKQNAVKKVNSAYNINIIGAQLTDIWNR